MLEKKMWPIVLVSISVWLSNPAMAEDIRLTSCDWRPYAAEDLPGCGFTSQIVDKAFERVGHKASFKFLPWRRAMLETEKGKYDAMYSAYHSEERAATYAVSAPYIRSQVGFCARKDSTISYKKLRGLAPYRIGVVKGYVNTPEFDQADYLEKDGAKSDVQNLKKLLKGRVDLIVIDKFVAIDHLKNTPGIEGDLRRVKFLNPPLSMSPVFVMFSKAIPGYEKKLADFNRGLKAIIDDGTYDTILEKHGFSH